ncbi:MAG TPA: PspA/IM30 family protein [Bryobacteraceae bacterium]|jgi:phage shock protein A
MALLERVSTLVRANLNDLIDQAENPEKMIKQVILDMQNQLLQVKTQAAIAMADQHVLERRHKETVEQESEWMRKADLAVGKQQDALARAALERALSSKQMAAAFAQQVADQKVEVENLRTALDKLEQKLAEAESKSEMLIAQHRRAQVLARSSEARINMGDRGKLATFDRMKAKVRRAEAIGQAKSEMASDDVEDKLATLEKDDQVEQLLAELKTKRAG